MLGSVVLAHWPSLFDKKEKKRKRALADSLLAFTLDPFLRRSCPCSEKFPFDTVKTERKQSRGALGCFQFFHL